MGDWIFPLLAQLWLPMVSIVCIFFCKLPFRYIWFENRGSALEKPLLDGIISIGNKMRSKIFDFVFSPSFTLIVFAIFRHICHNTFDIVGFPTSVYLPKICIPTHTSDLLNNPARSFTTMCSHHCLAIIAICMPAPRSLLFLVPSFVPVLISYSLVVNGKTTCMPMISPV